MVVSRWWWWCHRARSQERDCHMSQSYPHIRHAPLQTLRTTHRDDMTATPPAVDSTACTSCYKGASGRYPAGVPKTPLNINNQWMLD